MKTAIQIAVATLVTLALFWFMQLLIGGAEAQRAQLTPPVSVQIVRVKVPDDPIPPRPTTPQEPEARKEPPRPELVPPAVSGPEIRVAFDIPRNTNDGDPGLGPLMSGDATPVATIPPQYPRRALEDGIEGYVRLQFTIQPDGSVADVRVTESQPRAVFDDAARRAIARWRFRAQLVNGQPVASQAGYTIHFTLNDL